MSPQWYIYKDGTKYGPLSWEQIFIQASSGFIRPGDFLWCQGIPNWVRADTIQSLRFGGNNNPQNPNAAQGQQPYQQGYQNRQNPQNNNQNHQLVSQQTPQKYQNIQGPHRTKKISKPVLILSAALVTTIVIISGIYFLTRGGSKEVVETMGRFTVSKQGGAFKDSGIEFSAAGSQPDSPTEITVTKVDRKAAVSKDVSYQSEIYRIEGQLDKLGGKITIKMPIPKEALKAPYSSEKELAESLFIVVEEDSFTHSSETIPMQRRVPTKIDLSSNTLSAEIEVPKDTAETSKPIYYASLGNTGYSVAADETGSKNSTLTFQIKRYSSSLKEATASGGSFRAIYPSDVDTESVKELLTELEKQKKLMEQIGFSFSGCNFPVDVYIQDLDGAIGMYQGSKWSSSQYLYLKKYPYFTESMALQKKSGNWNEMVITIGHELLHLAESLYDNTGNFKKNHPWFSKPTLWLDEAVSTWYEPIAAGGKSYLSDNAKQNMDFIRNSLYNPAGDNSKIASHGYGASIFMTYLTKKLNDNTLPSKIYNGVKAQKSAINPGHAMNMAILDYGEFPEELWASFLETYLTRPGEIITGLDTASLWQKEAYIKASFKDNNYTLSYTGNDSMKSNISSVKDGDSMNPPVLTLHFSMNSMTGDAFKLKIADDADSKKFFEKPGNFKIKVTNKGKGGVMVYTTPRELRGTHTVAGAPWNFLSTEGDSRRQGGTEALVTSVSNADGKGAWKEILFIPFCNEDVVQSSKSDITIEISYEPADISGTWVGISTYDKIHFTGEITVEGVIMNSKDFISGKQAPIGFTITKDDNGYSADMRELFGYDISTKNSEFTGDTIKIRAVRDVENAFINLDGKLSEDKTTIEGIIEIGHTSHGVLFSGPFKVTRQEEQKGS